MATNCMRVVGARQHNLKNLTLTIPRDKLVVITGLSGSGKSSLAFDTIFAEGQRKYVESLSAYARQFLDQMQKPDVDYIEGLSPSIAIEQRSSSSNPRSIIATTTEIYDYLRLLFAHLGQPHCPVTGQPISRLTASEIVDRILDLPLRSRVMVLAPIASEEKTDARERLAKLAREGFVRARVDREFIDLGALADLKIDPKKPHQIEVVVDRLVIDDKIRVRLGDSVETALLWGEGRLLLMHQDGAAASSNGWNETVYTNRLYSPATGQSYELPTPKHFSFNSPHGACATCHGLGQKMVFDESLVVPDPAKSLEQGAILPWRRGGKRMIVYYKALLRGVTQHYDLSMENPFRSFPEELRKVFLWGSGDTEMEFHFWRAGKKSTLKRPFEGVIPNLQRLYAETESEFTKNRLKAFMNPQPCDVCGGRRLKPEVLAVTLGGPISRQHPAVDYPPPKSSLAPGWSIMDVCGFSVETAEHFFSHMAWSEYQQKVAGELIREILARLRFLKNVGLNYLTLDRESGTLSGGEAQRIRLATQIGAGLVGVLYILDEPSIGLHQRDNEKLLGTLEHLRDLGNSVLVVEHDEDTMRRADYLIDLGPGAGIHGGELVAQGAPIEVMQHPHSLTGRYLNGELSIPVPRHRHAPSREKGWLSILGAGENNLQNLDVHLPLGTLVCVTGVSGSGKSTLVDDILRRALFRQLYGSKDRPGVHREITGADQLDKVIVIDQTPIGRTPRSNPATYTAMFNHIRDLFCKLPSARIRGYGAGRFSFNVKGGRCERCQGDGMLKIEMHFLPPVYVTCEGCGGRRYNRETLDITYKGRTIAEVLDLTVDEAVDFFRAVPGIHDICLTLAEVGLGYLRLGQSATTLSGGEAQRIKLAAELSRRSTGRTLYILDEPTTGLHFHDVAKLLEVLFRLRHAGNTVLIIEHNLDVIKNADWIVDLGPEGGSGGGRIVATGTPEQIATCAASYTGQFLQRVLKRDKQPALLTKDA
jgi:excinuclease ABC subunit A